MYVSVNILAISLNDSIAVSGKFQVGFCYTVVKTGENIMKKILAITISAALLFSMTACSKEDKKDTKDTKKKSETTETTEEEEIEVEETDEDEPDEEQVNELKVVFKTTDRDGNEYTDAIFADYEVTMINMWEPWCGPCVEEMPDLQKLYENYSSKGFNIIGIYSETEMEDEVDDVLVPNTRSSRATKTSICFSQDMFRQHSLLIRTVTC